MSNTIKVLNIVIIIVGVMRKVTVTPSYGKIAFGAGFSGQSRA